MGVIDQTLLWAKVDEIVARAPGPAALRHHRLDLFAAYRERASGCRPSAALRAVERKVAMRSLAVPHLLGRIRAATDQRLVLMKGPEAAVSYPVPGCRPFIDLDILTPDADAAFEDLLRAGFVRTGKCDAGHHAPSLVWPGMPMVIELHRAPHYVPRLPVPAAAELMRNTHPSRTGVPGVEGFVPEAHAILLAVHAWLHGPLERLGPLVDVAAVLAEADRAAADQLARTWGCEKLWQTTTTAIDCFLGSRDASIPLRAWARHLLGGREPLVAELYIARLAAPAWALPRGQVSGGVVAEILRTVRPYAWESWDDQLLRASQALRHTFRPLSQCQERSIMETIA